MSSIMPINLKVLIRGQIYRKYVQKKKTEGKVLIVTYLQKKLEEQLKTFPH